MLRVEIADSPHKQAHGLMFRKHMSDRDGMIFIFRKAEKLRFWGVNTYIPLDIAFVDQHHRITKISQIKPLSDKSVQSDTDCHIAIEANLGYFESNNIHVGDTINFDRRSDKIGIVDFIHPRKKHAQVNDKISPDDIDPANVIQKIERDKNKIKTPDGLAVNQQQTNENGLPVISIGDLGGILEDSFDNEDSNDGLNSGPFPEDEQNTDTETPVPEISPDRLQEMEEPQTEIEPFDVPNEEDYPDFSSPQEALTWAEQNHEVTRIWYTTKGGRDIEREVEPHGQFMAESTGNPIVVTFDETIGGIRAFIVTNILYQSFVGRQFQPKFVVG